MKRFALIVAAGMLLGGLGAGSMTASAAPAVLPAATVAGDVAETVAMRHRHHSTRGQRRMRRMNTMRYGNPNARNPERPGYKQQLGGTTGGPRY